MSMPSDPPTTSDSNAPGPSNNANLDIPPPPSAISSRITDIVSEDEDSRPEPRRHASTSRRGPPPSAARHSITASSQTSRPPSSASRTSRTHIPSVTAHAFFRPMSSQRLQAQRGGRPLKQGSSAFSDDGQSEEASQKQRRSIISNATFMQGAPSQYEMEMPPPSRGTEFTDPVLPDRNTSNASPTVDTTIRSLGESVRLLHERSNTRPPPAHLNLGANYSTPAHDPPQKSPMSFRSGFLSMNNKDTKETRGHERLSSGATSPKSPHAKQPPSPAPPTSGKNFEFFLGNTVFCCGGRFQNSRDRPINIITGLLVVVPSALFCGFSAPWLWKHVSPAIPIVFAYLFYICMSSFLHASMVDPGIIPRNLHPMPPLDVSQDPLALGPPTNDWVMVKLATSEIAAMDVPVKYCKTCNIWRPPRCYHCRVCDNCVETLDHHCVWLNNCVGRRNYRYFFAFVSSATLLGLFVLGASLAHILLYKSQHGLSFGQAIDKLRVPFAMFIYGALAAPYPASLWGYHFFLMGRGETTREYLNSHKFQKKDRHRPFTQGNVLKNWIAVLGRPRPPTYLQFKAPHIEGDQRFGTQRGKKRTPDLESQAGMEMQDLGPPNPS